MTMNYLLNILGEVVYSKYVATEKTEIDLNNFQNGIYFIKVISKDKEVIMKTKKN